MTDFDVEAFDKKRVEDNKKLLKALTHYIEKYPSWRFSQILFNFGFVTGLLENEKCTVWANEFSIDPGDLLKRLGGMNLEEHNK